MSFDGLVDHFWSMGPYGILIGIVLVYLMIWLARRTWRTFRGRTGWQIGSRRAGSYQMHGVTPTPEPEDKPAWLPADVDVYLNGLLLHQGGDYGFSPDHDSITFEVGLRQNDTIQIRARDIVRLRNLRQVETLEEPLPAGEPLSIHFEPTQPEPDEPKITVGEDGWVQLLRPDVTLRVGDPVMHEGESFVVEGIHQDFNPAGHFTYAKLRPWKPPRTRWERMLDDDLD